MNIFAWIILLALVGEFLIDRITDLLNLRTTGDPLPEEFEDAVGGEAYKKSQAYTITTTKFSIVTASFNLVVLLAFWFLGGFNGLDILVRGWHLAPVWTGDCYIAVLLMLRGILSLPFDLYSTFVIEERFGFNKTTAATYAGDMLKSIALAVVLGGPVLTGVLAFFEYAGPFAWFYCWIATVAVMLGIQFIAPTWIMPLFNKFTPLEEGDLRRAIFAYAKSVHFRLDNIFVMDGSKRSGKSNAFFTGFGNNKRIALFDTLVADHTTDELVAVLAHEIGHYKRKHVLKGIAVSIVHTGVMFYVLSLFLRTRGLFDAFSMNEISVYGGLIFFGLLATPIESLISIVLNHLSRRHEFEADRWASDTTSQPESLISALKKLSVHNLSHLTPHPVYVFWHYSHPPVLRRIRALRGAGQT